MILISGKHIVFACASVSLVSLFGLIVYLLLIGPTVITSTEPAPGDEFGKCVSLSDSYLAISRSETQHLHQSNEVLTPSSVSIFDLETQELVHEFKDEKSSYIVNSRDDGSTYKSHPTFADSISIGRDQLVVGITWIGGDRGEAQVFDLNTGLRLALLALEGGQFQKPPTLYGNSVGIGGNRAIVGSVSPGFADVFDISRATPRRLFRLQLEESSNTPFFGIRVAVSENFAAVASREEVFIFNLTEGLLSSVFTAGKDFIESQGNIPSLAIHGGQLICGMRNHQGFPEEKNHGENYNYHFGTVYVVNLENGDLIHRLFAPNKTPGDMFGHSVAASEKYVVVGAPGRGDIAARTAATQSTVGSGNMGEVFVFNRLSGELLLYMRGPEPDVCDDFGYSVAINETHLAVGAPSYSVSAKKQHGNVYLYKLKSLGL